VSKIHLTEGQFLHVSAAALALGPNDRDAFWQAVADELQGQPIGDGSVGRAIRAAQLRFPHPNVANGPHVPATKWK
jgi:hypothetical protein